MCVPLSSLEMNECDVAARSATVTWRYDAACGRDSRGRACGRCRRRQPRRRRPTAAAESRRRLLPGQVVVERVLEREQIGREDVRRIAQRRDARACGVQLDAPSGLPNPSSCADVRLVRYADGSFLRFRMPPPTPLVSVKPSTQPSLETMYCTWSAIFAPRRIGQVRRDRGPAGIADRRHRRGGATGQGPRAPCPPWRPAPPERRSSSSRHRCRGRPSLSWRPRS